MPMPAPANSRPSITRRWVFGPREPRAQRFGVSLSRRFPDMKFGALFCIRRLLPLAAEAEAKFVRYRDAGVRAVWRLRVEEMSGQPIS